MSPIMIQYEFSPCRQVEEFTKLFWNGQEKTL